MVVFMIGEGVRSLAGNQLNACCELKAGWLFSRSGLAAFRDRLLDCGFLQGAYKRRFSICCGLTETGEVVLDPTKLEEQTMKAFVYLVFPNSISSALPQVSLDTNDESMEHGIITSVTHGVMSVENYFRCLQRGRAAASKLSDFLRNRLQSAPHLCRHA